MISAYKRQHLALLFGFMIDAWFFKIIILCQLVNINLDGEGKP